MATWREVGYAPVLAVVADNGSNKVRITYPGLECDWKLYKDCPADSTWYAYNVTRSAAAAITAKGAVSGTTYREKDEAGFTFDLDLTYSGTSWAAGDRVWIIGEATLRVYTTPALMKAALNAFNDKTIFGYRDAAGTDANWPCTISECDNMIFSMRGMLSRQRVTLMDSGYYGLYFNLGADGATEEQRIENLTLPGESGTDGSPGFRFIQSAGTAAVGVTLDRVIFRAAKVFLDPKNPTPVVLSRCMLVHSLGVAATRFWAGTVSAIHCTMLALSVGSLYSGSSSWLVIKNCLTFGMGVAPIGVQSTYSCWDTAPGGAGNLENKTRAEMAFWDGHDGGYFSVNGRILTTSIANNAGSYDASYPEDIDGNPITNGHAPMGAHVPTAQAYNVSWPAANQVLTGNNFTNFAGAQTASAPPASVFNRIHKSTLSSLIVSSGE